MAMAPGKKCAPMAAPKTTPKPYTTGKTKKRKKS